MSHQEDEMLDADRLANRPIHRLFSRSLRRPHADWLNPTHSRATSLQRRESFLLSPLLGPSCCYHVVISVWCSAYEASRSFSPDFADLLVVQVDSLTLNYSLYKRRIPASTP